LFGSVAGERALSEEDEDSTDSLASDEQDDWRYDLPHWESAALSKVQGILSTARFDAEEGTVTVESDDWDPKGDFTSRSFASLDELRDELVGLGDSEIIGYVPWENGPVFSTDSSDLVDTALQEAGVPDFFDSLEPPADSELLIGLEDLCEPEGAERVQLDLEEINDLLIQYLATHPELMRDVHPRRFEELVAELFRRMGYEVILTPPARDGGRDLKAFQKNGLGTLLTLVECKRFSPDHKVGVGLVRSLYGVVEAERASQGIIATTSSFTRGARLFQQNLQYRLSLRDFTDLANWCKQYKR